MAGYRLHVLDLRGWKPFVGIRRPDPFFTDYPTREDAEVARRALRQHEDVHTNITAVPAPKTREPRRKPASAHVAPDPLGGRNHSADRRLTL